jgi:TPR repeat protein
MITRWNRFMPPEKPSLRRIERIVKDTLARSLEPDTIDPIINEAEEDNPAAQYIVASALELAGEKPEAIRWYRRAADQGYRPALERLRRLSDPAA